MSENIIAHNPAQQQANEIWRDIPEHPGYQASSIGRVRSSHGKGRNRTIGNEWRILNPWKDKHGYLIVYLAGKRRGGVHRLVLMAFVGPCPPGMEARHIQVNDPTDNRIDNLAWGTPQQNSDDRHRHGAVPVGEEAPASKLTAQQVREIANRAAAGEQRKSLAKEFGLRGENVSRILNGKHWRHLDIPRKIHESTLADHISTVEAAGILGITKEAVQYRIKHGMLPAVRCRRGFFLPRAAVHAAPRKMR